MARALRGFLAILGGLVTVFAVDGLCYYTAQHGFNVSFDRPTTGFLLFNLFYSYVSRTLGGFVAGDIVHRRTILPGIVLAALLLLLGWYNLHKGFGVFGRSTVFVVLLNVVGPLFAVLGGILWSRSRGPGWRAH